MPWKRIAPAAQGQPSLRWLPAKPWDRIKEYSSTTTRVTILCRTIVLWGMQGFYINLWGQDLRRQTPSGPASTSFPERWNRKKLRLPYLVFLGVWGRIILVSQVGSDPAIGGYGYPERLLKKSFSFLTSSAEISTNLTPVG